MTMKTKKFFGILVLIAGILFLISREREIGEPFFGYVPPNELSKITTAVNPPILVVSEEVINFISDGDTLVGVLSKRYSPELEVLLNREISEKEGDIVYVSGRKFGARYVIEKAYF